MTLARGNYEATEDTKTAIEIARESIVAVRLQDSQAPISSSHGEHSSV